MQPSASELGTWVMVLFMVVSAAGTCVTIVTNFRTQRRQVSFEGEYARKDDFDSSTKQLNEDRKFDVREIHRRIDSLSAQVSGVETATEMLNQRMVQVDGKLDRMIERGSS